MNKIECSCTRCGLKFQKPVNEYNRRMKKGKKLYCSRECAGVANLGNFGEKRNTKPPIKRQKVNPFKYYLKMSKNREYECLIDLDYLKELWESQNGICPYTKINLILSSHANRNLDKRYTASLDRIDSSKGYVPGNVQFISMAINYMKNTMSHEQTVEFLNLIKTNLSN